jgi:hypothetical protein
MEYDPRIASLTEPVVFFPVRHHSPACARLLRVLAERLRPNAILIEGPSDFNTAMPELYHPHTLPIAIYSYVRLANNVRQGAFYPFCVYSPEWQALQASLRLAIPARFIDLPYADRALRTGVGHLYADTQERRSSYFETVAAELGVEGFDNLWDTLFEIDRGLEIDTYLERAHRFMYCSRVTERHLVTWQDQRRERFMSEQILGAKEVFGEPLMVVTGGFHSSALFARLHGIPFEEEVPAPAGNENETQVAERGIALTPYSYERLDALKGYDAGMPNPGFYDRVWSDLGETRTNSYRTLLAQVAGSLRAQKQPVSTADLIAVETMARGLANLRGHAAVWRQDLVDGVVAALLKEEVSAGGRHPFLDALHDVLRGNRRGRLAAGTVLPPIVGDIERQLQLRGLELKPAAVTLSLDLHEPEDLIRVRVLHQLAILPVAGFTLAGGAPIARPGDSSTLIERWKLQWSPEFDANCIEAAIYGPTLCEASLARLTEQAAKFERSASEAARLLLEACFMGHLALTREFHTRLTTLLREDGDFISVGAALARLLYVFRYDDVLGSAGLPGVGELLAETYNRALWLIEGCGSREGEERDFIFAVRALRDTFERCGATLELDRGEFVTVLRRAASAGQWATLRGALTGALWSLSEATTAEVGASLPCTTDPVDLGDFLVGLFHVAREVAQRNSELTAEIDRIVQSMDAEDFLAALPALRLAFSVFTPREKDLLAATLFSPLSDTPALDIPENQAAKHLAWEARLLSEMGRYRIRGGLHP